jgi:amidase
MWPFSSAYKVLSETKKSQRDGALSAAPKFSLSEHGQFLKATASEIVGHIERGEWTSSEVVTAYIARAVSAHETTNCVTEGESTIIPHDHLRVLTGGSPCSLV